jgi:hypothetical protein
MVTLLSVAEWGTAMLKGHPARTLPTYTTVDTIWSRSRKRWLLGVEKLASLGFAATDDIAKKYNIESCHVYK